MVDIIAELREYGIEPIVSDPAADPAEAEHKYDIDLVDISQVKGLDVLIIAVAHDELKQMSLDDYGSLFKSPNLQNRIIVDVKGILDKQAVEALQCWYWRL